MSGAGLLMVRCFAWLVFIVTALCSAGGAVAAEKVALVVGNSAYRHTPELRNPKNDAAAVSAALKSIGFEVFPVQDADRRTFDDAMKAFAEAAAEADFAIVYYAGHGIQVQGTTYLIPIDANPKSERDLRYLIPADHVMEDAARAKKLAVVILDACRDNPFIKAVAESAAAPEPGGLLRSVSIGRGLSRLQQVPTNTLLVYATQAGNVAIDGEDANSPFAEALVSHIKTPNKDVRLVLGQVRDDVLKLTQYKQEPYIYGSLGGDSLILYATGEAAPQQQIALALKPQFLLIPEVSPGGAPPAAGFIDDAFAMWQSAKNTSSWEDVEELRLRHGGTLYGWASDQLLAARQRRAGASLPEAIAAVSSQDAILRLLTPSIIQNLQRSLKDLNYYHGALSGVYDQSVQVALTAFALDHTRERRLTNQVFMTLMEYSGANLDNGGLSGTWRGTYYYPRPANGVSSVDFEMDLTFSQSNISGFISEPNTFGNKSSANLYASFEGGALGNDLSWTKTYDGTGGISHSITYEGKLDRRAKRIEGKWSFPGNWSGRFVITRK